MYSQTKTSVRKIFPSERFSPWGECNSDHRVEIFTLKFEIYRHRNWSKIVKILVFPVRNFFSFTLFGQVEKTSDTPEKDFRAFFDNFVRTQNFLEKWFYSKLFPAYVDCSFDKSKYCSPKCTEI